MSTSTAKTRQPLQVHTMITDPLDRPVAGLKLSHGVKARLAENGYRTVGDLLASVAADLSLELNLSAREATDILDSARAVVDGEDPQSLAHSASDMLAASSSRRFSTLCDPIDRLIGHCYHDTPVHVSRKGKERAGDFAAVEKGMSVEITGPPGSGKTAMAIALALSARRGIGSSEEMSTAPEVLLIDTEGSIPPERLKRAAECLLRDSSESPLDLIDGIHLIRIATQAQMVALLHILDEWLLEHPKVNLVIFDTLSFHLRQPTLDIRTRSRLLELVKQQIGKAVTIRNCAVIVVNQLATKLLTAENKPANFKTGDRAVLMPQLGDSWMTAKAIRLVLFRGGINDEMRYAHASSVTGSSIIPWVRYDIDQDGLPCNPEEEEGDGGEPD